MGDETGKIRAMVGVTSNQKVRRNMWTGVGILFVGEILSAFFVPKSYQDAVLGALCVLLSAFVAWDVVPMPPRDPDQSGRGPTIREQLQRTNALFMRVMVPLMATWVVFVTFYFPGLSRLEGIGIAAGGGLVLVVPAMLFLSKRSACPRCGSNFRKERFAQVGRWSADSRPAYELWDKCPNCGASFDEPYRQPMPIGQ